MRLRRNEYCPVHRSLFCCGREAIRRESKPRIIRMGVQRIEDPHHPRGYRELRSPGEMRKLLNRKIRQQAGVCALCHEEFTDYNDIVPYADVGIRDRMPTFRICRSILRTALKRVVRDQSMSAYSDRLKKREERIGGPVAAGTCVYWRGPRECLFFEREVRMKVDLRGFHLLMTEPEGNNREVDPSM
jgi:hypothetical protein